MTTNPEFSSAGEPRYAETTSIYATISLISGVLAWLGVFGLGGLLAIIFGYVAKNEIQRNRGRIGGEELANAGLILGYVNVALFVAGFCLVALLVALGFAAIPFCFVPSFSHWNSEFTHLLH